MNTFQWIDVRSVEEAVALLATPASHGATIAKAGGLDLLDLMKEGIIAPARIVNLQRIDALRGVQFTDTAGLRLGALTSLAEIASDATIRRNYPALGEAAAHAATPQIRNAATIGGNLLQRPRCWYFRNQLFHAAREEAGRDHPEKQRRIAGQEMRVSNEAGARRVEEREDPGRKYSVGSRADGENERDRSEVKGGNDQTRSD